MAVRQAHTQAFAARRAAMQTAHLGRRPGFVDEHQPLGIEIDLPFEPSLSPFQDIGAVLLVRVARLFLSVIRRRWKKRHRPEELAATPRSARPA